MAGNAGIATGKSGTTMSIGQGLTRLERKIHGALA